MSDPLTCDNRKDLREWAGVRDKKRERNAHKHTQKLDKISKIQKNTWVRLRFHSQEPIELTLPINIFTYYLIGLLLLARLKIHSRISTIFLSVHSRFVFDANFCISKKKNKNEIARIISQLPTNKQRINQIIMSRLFTCN